MLPDWETANAILDEAEQNNPGKWVPHSRFASNVARKIAVACNMNSERAATMALLHDIGRKYGVMQFAHIVEGYRYMMQLGYYGAARACLTHSFVTKDVDDYLGKIDVDIDDVNMISELLDEIVYDDYDRLIQLSDNLATGDGPVDLEYRMSDVEQRYGRFPEAKKEEYRKLKKYFESIAGKSIEVLLGE